MSNPRAGGKPRTCGKGRKSGLPTVLGIGHIGLESSPKKRNLGPRLLQDDLSPLLPGFWEPDQWANNVQTILAATPKRTIPMISLTCPCFNLSVMSQAPTMAPTADPAAVKPSKE